MNDEEIVREFLRKIGSKGGKTRAAKHSRQQLRAWAKLGGRPRKDGTKSKRKNDGESKGRTS